MSSELGHPLPVVLSDGGGAEVSGLFTDLRPTLLSYPLHEIGLHISLTSSTIYHPKVRSNHVDRFPLTWELAVIDECWSRRVQLCLAPGASNGGGGFDGQCLEYVACKIHLLVSYRNSMN